MTNNTENNKRIAKNSLLLYFRMFLTMGVSLYTSRIILQTLGITDYGIYNVVGGVVAMFNFINGSLSGASSRFITYTLGENNLNKLRTCFNTITFIHVFFALIVFILAETIGLWFVIEKLTIPTERLNATIWAYQSTILTAIILLISSPFNALIISHEKMGAFAYISIIEALAKLLIVYALYILPFDRLIIYSILLIAVQCCIAFIYIIYCRRNFIESKFNITQIDKQELYKIISYTSWTINGSLAVIGYTQGLNIILNIFYGPAVNAARGIAVQVQGAVNNFFNNFLTAVKPQITKSYAQKNYDYMHKLVISSSKYSFFLSLFIALPLLYSTEYILKIWLGIVPEYTSQFIKIMILVSMNYAIAYPTISAIHATGNIKKFQIVESSLLLLVIPVCYISVRIWNISPVCIFIIYLIIEIITQFARVWIIYPQIDLPKRIYFKKILLPISIVCASVWIAPTLFQQTTSIQNEFIQFIILSITCIISCIVCIYLFGLDKIEKQFITNKIKHLPILNKQSK